MATTRKRARTVNEAFTAPSNLVLSVDSLIAFCGDDDPSPQLASYHDALDLAVDAAEAFIGQPIGDTTTHNISHGVHLLAAHLLMTNQLERQPAPSEIPLVVRALWRSAHAGHPTV